jgi:hypothetical protein
MRGTGLAIIDGKPQTIEARIGGLQQVADQQGVRLNLSTLFDSLDHCECDECLSVYSPAAYFVELLQFLRNNDLDPNNPNTGKKGIAGTPLEKLFRRRPDLGCLELTCENTFTVLPYIDLVNEVMESFVVHLNDYHKDKHNPKQTTLEAFNVVGETSSELLAIPQHVNYDAYSILGNAVYPFTLPYHQPIDATRIFLNYLGTSRWELLDTYRTAKEDSHNAKLSEADEKELQALHTSIQDRAVDAEFLGMTQEEYIILTKEAFRPKRYLEIVQQTPYTDDKYQQNIGVRLVSEYYGYAYDSDMLSLDEDDKTGEKGLTFVKKQFLPRTGIQYADLVELLKARFINPNFPEGQALTILESIRFSYRFLQTLVDANSNDPQTRFAKLVAYLETIQPLVPAINALLHPDLCHKQNVDSPVRGQDFRNWVYCYFDRIGQLIVLDSGEGPQLPIEGQLFSGTDASQVLGTLHRDGSITDSKGERIGNVTFDGHVLASDGEPFLDKYGSEVVYVDDGQGQHVGRIHDHQDQGMVEKSELFYYQEQLTRMPQDILVSWLPARDTCDLDKVRLTHLDGTPVTVAEYDRLQRFIRLWRKLGWTIDETDKALVGLAATPATSVVPATCPDLPHVDYRVTPAFLHELVAVRKLLDSTGLPLDKLLAFWAEIGSAGEKSLYSKLFLTHNLIAIDTVFQPDAQGNFLTQPAKITDHIPVLMAAFKLKADDIAAIMSIGVVPDSLTLSNVSLLYRYSLLAKILHLRVPLLRDVVDLFGNPFKNAWDTLALLETWGKMEDAGFTFRQLDYLILNRDDALRPLTPSKKTILQLTKTLYDGLTAIDHDHPDITQKEDATANLVRAAATLLFGQDIVEQIIGLLEGTSVYTYKSKDLATLSIKVPDSLSKKLKFSTQKDTAQPMASVQVTGILTDTEVTEANKLAADPRWAKALDCVGKEPHLFLNDALFAVFSDTAGLLKTLLAGDVADSNDPQYTAPGKRLYFLQKFLPFLRAQLAQRLIVNTLSGAAGLPTDITNLLLSKILQVGTNHQPAMAALEHVKDKPVVAPSGWSVYLIPSAAAAYTFVISSDKQPADLLIGHQHFAFHKDDPSNQCSDDSRRWSSQPIDLKSGTLYLLEVADPTVDKLEWTVDKLEWKTAISPLAPIPSSALLPDYSSQGTADAFTKLYKAALVVNGFNLSADEVSYFQTHAADFDG